MPYTFEQCQAFGAMASRGESVPDDWKDKCRGVTANDGVPFPGDKPFEEWPPSWSPMKKVLGDARYFFDTKLEICDKSMTRTPEGFLQVQGIIARPGKQIYLDAELGIGAQGKKVTVERPVAEVTNAMAIASFLGKPVTDDHPIEDGLIDAKNARRLARGTILDVEPTDSSRVKANMLIYDDELIQKVEAGKRELSAGYTARLEIADDGKTLIQRDIRGNHVAFVDAGRCGTECRIFDSSIISKQPEGGTNMAKVKLNGIEYEIADSVAPVVQGLSEENKRLSDALAAAEGKSDELKSQLEEAQAKIQDEDTLKKAILDGVAEMTKVLDAAKVLGVEVDMKDADPVALRRKIVLDRYPDLKDKPDAYLDARFDVMVEAAAEKNKTDQEYKDAFRSVLDSEPVSPIEKARLAKMKRTVGGEK